VVAIYSTFLQRAYDQLIHDVALQNLPVVFALDRAGLVGADGPTHAGAYDIAYLRCIPNMSIACPSDENETRKLLTTAYQQAHPVAVRYPRGTGVGTPVEAGLHPLPFGRGELRRKGQKIAVLAFGTLLHPALQAAERLDLTVANMRWVKPLDTELLLQLAASHDALVTVEEGASWAARAARSPRRCTRPASSSRCCNWACATRTRRMAIPRGCWRCRGWMRRASRRRSRRASAALWSGPRPA
jgi:1-deoxy-D-xylulose-5-phosphate synthase